LSSGGLLVLPAVASGGVFVVAGAGFQAAAADADESASAGAVIVFRSGLRFPAAGVSVFRWGHPATRTPHDEPSIHPAC
jgi:hypothetical protein